MVAEYKACSFKKNARKGIVSKSEKAYRSVYQSLYYVSANCSDRRIYIDTFIGIDISKSQFIGGMKVGEPSADGRGSAPPELAEQQARAGSEAAPATPPL